MLWNFNDDCPPFAYVQIWQKQGYLLAYHLLYFTMSLNVTRNLFNILIGSILKTCLSMSSAAFVLLINVFTMLIQLLDKRVSSIYYKAWLAPNRQHFCKLVAHKLRAGNWELLWMKLFCDGSIIVPSVSCYGLITKLWYNSLEYIDINIKQWMIFRNY